MHYDFGLCLAGGGARGIAHVGALQALEDYNLAPNAISGASAGALVGALYCAGVAPADILKIFKESSVMKLFRFTVPTIGLSDNQYLVEQLSVHIPDNTFESLKIPLFVAVTNLTQGKWEILQSGLLFEAVAASASIPVIFRPNHLEGSTDMYADGGLLNNLPVEPLKERCKIVAGINVTPILPANELGNIMDLGYRVFDLVLWANVAPRLAQCDIAIEPLAGQYGIFAVSQAEEIYQAGYQAMKDRIPQLSKLLGKPFSQNIPIAFADQHSLAFAAVAEVVEANAWKRFWRRIAQWFLKLFKRKSNS